MATVAPIPSAGHPGLGPPDSRNDPRLDFVGEDLRIMLDGMPFLLRLKNLSSKGVGGLTDAPVARGQIVTLVLNNGEQVTAEIRWTCKAMVGAAFSEPLAMETMKKLRSRHRALKRRHGG